MKTCIGKRTLELAIAVMVSVVSINSNAQQPDARTAKIAASFSEVLNNCPTRVWPGLDWKDFEIVLVDALKKQAWSWAGVGGLSAIDYSSLGQQYTVPRYNFTMRNGKRALVISLNDTERSNKSGQPSLTDFAVQLSFHEGFHWFEQFRTIWPSMSSGGSNDRSQIFPSESEPRYLRRMLLVALRDAYVGTDQNAGLNAAAYWYEKWKSKYPEEVASARSSDVTEGTAFYVELVASSLSVVGCASSESALNSYIASQIDRILSLEKPIVIALLESYEVGALAALNLRKLGAADWQSKMVSSQTPLEALLSNRQASVQKDDLSLAARAKSESDQANKQVEEAIKPMLNQLKSSSYLRVSYPVSWSGGSLGHQGEYRLKNQSDLLVTIHARGQFRSKDGTNSIEMKDTTLIGNLPSPCGETDNKVALVDSAKVSKAGAMIGIDSENMKISGALNLQTDANGFVWQCFK